MNACDFICLCVAGRKFTDVQLYSAYPSGQAQGDVALLSSVHYLHLKVVAACAEGLPGLGQTHVQDALPLPNVLQELLKCVCGGGEIGSVFKYNIL